LRRSERSAWSTTTPAHDQCRGRRIFLQSKTMPNASQFTQTILNPRPGSGCDAFLLVILSLLKTKPSG
jgi:hypothetical protein